MRGIGRMVGLVAAAALVACGGDELDTRTFELQYMDIGEAQQLISPYVYAQREGAPGTFAAGGSAITVRETPENLERIGIMLERLDRPRPLVTLHFQIIRADGARALDPAIAEVERELRRLFRFEGYELVAETRVGVRENATVRQLARGGGEEYLIEGGVGEVRYGEEGVALTLEVRLSTEEVGAALMTQITIPVDHTVVLGTAETESAGALILVVRAEVAGGEAPSPATPAAAPADTASIPG